MENTSNKDDLWKVRLSDKEKSVDMIQVLMTDRQRREEHGPDDPYYIVVSRDSEERLSFLVREYLMRGYKLQGGVSHTFRRGWIGNTEGQFSQALTHPGDAQIALERGYLCDESGESLTELGDAHHAKD